MVGMGAVVTASVPAFHLSLGHPARSVGCVCRCGQLLARFSQLTLVEPTRLNCPACDRRYEVQDQVVREWQEVQAPDD